MIMGNCRVCEKPATTKCRDCKKYRNKNIYYCSRECQVSDWKQQHKAECKKPSIENSVKDVSKEKDRGSSDQETNDKEVEDVLPLPKVKNDSSEKENDAIGEKEKENVSKTEPLVDPEKSTNLDTLIAKTNKLGIQSCRVCAKPATTKCGDCKKKRNENVYYCSKDCQVLDWKKRHRAECRTSAIANGHGSSDQEQRILVLTNRDEDVVAEEIRRSFLPKEAKAIAGKGKQKASKKKQKAIDREACLARYKKADEVGIKANESPVEYTIPFKLGSVPGKGKGMLATKPIIKCDVLLHDFNVRERKVDDGTIGTHWKMLETTDGMKYSDTRNFNHSCLPNAEFNFVDDSVRIYALRDIAEREEICISYIRMEDCEWDEDPEISRTQPTLDNMRKIIKRIYGFDCRCELCTMSDKERRDEINEKRLDYFLRWTLSKYLEGLYPPARVYRHFNEMLHSCVDAKLISFKRLLNVTIKGFEMATLCNREEEIQYMCNQAYHGSRVCRGQSDHVTVRLWAHFKESGDPEFILKKKAEYRKHQDYKKHAQDFKKLFPNNPDEPSYKQGDRITVKGPDYRDRFKYFYNSSEADYQQMECD